MRVAVQAGESAPVPAVERAERESPGQPTTGSVTAGGDPERDFASDRRRQAQAARPGDGGGARSSKRDGRGIFRGAARARCGGGDDRDREETAPRERHSAGRADARRVGPPEGHTRTIGRAPV